MTSTDIPYRVLARKYRPATFADLIGQDAMVRTLRNAFAADRIAHAFILTGVRGVGKTTTARIIAKGLNCIGPDGQGGPTIEPCGICDPCRAIAEGRHVDVLEMDAASRTGVGDIREIIDSVAYRAASARYKVYIIDEVHMLSTSAFNALLKTLEEPPAHVKFIFATTEIRKVPVTVLSRCQRFDLRRIEPDAMLGHLAGIAEKESIAVDPAAMALIVRAAEGSVRDALSLLDQAIAHGGGAVEADEVRAMLGLADRGRILDLFEAVMAGDVVAALSELGEQCAAGADPAAVLRDLAEVTHWVSMLRIAPDAAADPTVAPDERRRGLDFAARLGVPVLSRSWQLLLKALAEVDDAPNAKSAAEMALIRLTHLADLPTPSDLIRRLTGGSSVPSSPQAAPEPRGGGGARALAAVPLAAVPPAAAVAEMAPQPVAAASPQTEAVALARYERFEDVVALVRARRDLSLLIEIESGVRLVKYAPGRIEFEPSPDAAPDLAARISQRLRLWTGVRWGVSVVATGGAATMAETRTANRNDLRARAKAHPLVQAVLAAFPGAEITDVRPAEVPSVDVPPPPEDDDWDPFDPLAEED